MAAISLVSNTVSPSNLRLGKFGVKGMPRKGPGFCPRLLLALVFFMGWFFLVGGRATVDHGEMRFPFFGGSLWCYVVMYPPMYQLDSSCPSVYHTTTCPEWVLLDHFAGSSRRLDQSLYQGTWYLGRLATWRCHGDRARREFDCDLWPLMIAKWEWEALEEKNIYALARGKLNIRYTIPPRSQMWGWADAGSSRGHFKRLNVRLRRCDWMFAPNSEALSKTSGATSGHCEDQSGLASNARRCVTWPKLLHKYLIAHFKRLKNRSCIWRYSYMQVCACACACYFACVCACLRSCAFLKQQLWGGVTVTASLWSSNLEKAFGAIGLGT